MPELTDEQKAELKEQFGDEGEFVDESIGDLSEYESQKLQVSQEFDLDEDDKGEEEPDKEPEKVVEPPKPEVKKEPEPEAEPAKAADAPEYTPEDIAKMKEAQEELEHLKTLGPKGLQEALKRVVPEKATEKILEPIKYDPDILFSGNYSRKEVLAHMDEVRARDMEIAAQKAAMDNPVIAKMVSEQENAILEAELPVFKDPGIKKAVRAIDRMLESDPTKLQRIKILAAAAGSPELLIAMGEKKAKIEMNDKLAAENPRGVTPPAEISVESEEPELTEQDKELMAQQAAADDPFLRPGTHRDG